MCTAARNGCGRVRTTDDPFQRAIESLVCLVERVLAVVDVYTAATARMVEHKVWKLLQMMGCCNCRAIQSQLIAMTLCNPFVFGVGLVIDNTDSIVAINNASELHQRPWALDYPAYVVLTEDLLRYGLREW